MLKGFTVSFCLSLLLLFAPKVFAQTVVYNVNGYSPPLLTRTNSSDTTITVNVDSGNQQFGTTVTTFRIFYYQPNTTPTQFIDVDYSNRNGVVISGLTPNTDYRIHAHACRLDTNFNELACSGPSTVINDKTLASGQNNTSGIPIANNVAAEKVLDDEKVPPGPGNQARITWDAVAYGSSPLQYVIYYYTSAQLQQSQTAGTPLPSMTKDVNRPGNNNMFVKDYLFIPIPTNEAYTFHINTCDKNTGVCSPPSNTARADFSPGSAPGQRLRPLEVAGHPGEFVGRRNIQSAFCSDSDEAAGHCSKAVSDPCPINDEEKSIPIERQTGVKTAIGCVPTQPKELVAGLIRVAAAAGGGIALLLMIFGAFKMITSAGNADSLKGGRDQFTAAIVGLLFITFSVLLLQFIGVDILNLPGFTR